MDKYIDSAKIRQLSFIAILIILGWVLFRELQTFIPAFLGALTLYVLMRRYMFQMVYAKKWKKGRAAAVLMLLSFLVIMVPVLLLANIMSEKISYAVNHSQELIKSVEKIAASLQQKTGIKLFDQQNIQNMTATVTKSIPLILGATFGTISTVAMCYFLLYFMLVNCGQMEKKVGEWLPMHETNMTKVGKEVKNMVVSNAIGIPVIAILQGLVGLVGYLLIGVKEPWLWFAVTCITAMIPIVGAALAYVPLGIIFFANGDTWRGIIMLAYGFGIIGLVDNVFRFTLQKKIGDVHPIITVLGVIIGVNLFGFIGLIFGPLLISLFLLLVRIYSQEFTEPDAEVDANLEKG